LDVKDLQILRLMGVQPFADWPREQDHLKPSYFAKHLGLSVEAAKARVRRMEKDGIIAGYEVYPNFSLLGYTCVGFLFHLPRPATAQTMADLQAVDGVGIVERYLGPAIRVDLFERSPSAMDRRVQLVSRILGATDHSRYAAYPSSPVARKPTRLDWRIIQALRGRATRPLGDVADELGVNARTVTRHFDRLWAEGSIDTVARLNTGNVPGHLFANVAIRFTQVPPAAVTQRLHKEFEEQWAYCWSPPDREVANLVMGLAFRSPSHMQETVDRIRTMPDVADVEGLLSAQSTTNEAWLTEALQRAAHAAPDPGEAPLLSKS
jgi:DNA-binding Lrp family transcriptional regulator